jgi:single-stranded DNA-binding protein
MMALIQSIILEMFAGKDAEPLYTEKGQFIVKFPACWSRGPEEKLWFDCVVWGNIPTSDKPTSQELGWLAAYVHENVKEGDRILVRGRLQGTADGKPSLWVDKTKIVHASYLSLTVQELSITEAKANRPVKAPAPMPAIEETTDGPVETQTSASTAVGLPVKSPTTANDVFANYLSKS